MTWAQGFPLLLGALVSGLLASVHCLAMCGPLILAAQVVAAAPPGSPSRAASHALPIIQATPGAQSGWHLGHWRAGATYHLLRIAGYSLLGGVLAGLGAVSTRRWIPRGWPYERWALCLVAASLVAYALLGMRGSNRLIGQRFWKLFSAPTSRLLRITHHYRLPLLGAVTPLLPCGVLYSTLLSAFLIARPLWGAGFMLCFGVGTVPLLLLLQWQGAFIRSRLPASQLRLAIRLLFIVAAAALLFRALGQGEHGAHTGESPQLLCR